MPPLELPLGQSFGFFWPPGIHFTLLARIDGAGHYCRALSFHASRQWRGSVLKHARVSPRQGPVKLLTFDDQPSGVLPQNIKAGPPLPGHGKACYRSHYQ